MVKRSMAIGMKCLWEAMGKAKNGLVEDKVGIMGWE